MVLARHIWKIVIFSTWINIVVSGLKQTSNSKKLIRCTKEIVGQRMFHKNRMGYDRMLICSGDINGIYLWRFLDGSSTLGEVFNAAKDCSDVVDNIAEVKDGFYWVLVNNATRKVWCDVHTDGGGFMLVGMNDNPTSWTVPSSSIPVDPRGTPHWSSALGDIEVQDFAIQISTAPSFDKTQSHWLYRLKPKRELGKLFSQLCTSAHAGIDDVEYVKDILTESVVTRNFSCSKFGTHFHRHYGWGRMNYCLQHDCKNGYAIFPGASSRHDDYGSFSYSVVSSSSGIIHNSTAFVGCDDGKCCACFGPKGGRNDYCGPKCTAINGGKVIQKAFVWFWVRTSMPKRVWKRCMEFKMKNTDGQIETYFIDLRTGTARKGSCSYHFKTFLNEGTLTVADKESLQKIPPVPGLLSYRADNKQLYVNNGSKWDVLDNEKEVLQLKEKFNNLDKMLKGYVSCTALKTDNMNVSSGFYNIKPQGIGFSSFKVYCDMTSNNGVGVTVIGHDSEAAMKVDGCESSGCYSRKIKYDVPMERITAIIRNSKRCEQLIKYQCYGSVFTYGGHSYAWWVSRQGAQMKYWGGATVDSGKCACGRNNSCAGGGSCNCDKNDYVLREDSGFLTDKNTLPVTELRFGDTGGSIEYGYHTLGKLLCWG